MYFCFNSHCPLLAKGLLGNKFWLSTVLEFPKNIKTTVLQSQRPTESTVSWALFRRKDFQWSPYTCAYILFICSVILGNVFFPCSIEDLWVGVGFSFLRCLEWKFLSLIQRAKENMWKSQSQFTKLPLLPHPHHKYMASWRGCISGKHGMLSS